MQATNLSTNPSAQARVGTCVASHSNAAGSTSDTADALRGLACLLVLQALGEGLVRTFRLPFPGPVAGMMLLIPALQRPWIRGPVRAASQALLAHLSLFFVPVGVGVITHLDLLSRSGAGLLSTIAVSTWVGMTVTALVLNALLRRRVAEELESE